MSSKAAGFRTFRFDQMATLINDRVDNPSESGVERYVGLEHLDADSLRIRRWGEITDVESTKLRFQPGDIIFGKRRVYQRKLAVADFEGICSAHAMVLRAKENVVLPEFLPFFMQSDRFMERALAISVGSLSPTINWTTLAAEEFALPPIEKQKRISAILQAIESVLWGFDNSLESVFASWRSLSHAEFSKRAGRGPALDIHFTIASGQVDPKEPEYAKLPLIAPNHIEPGRGRVTELVSAAAQAANSGKYLYEAGSVLYSKIRPELRKAAIAPCRGLCSADMYPLTPSRHLRAEYLLEILLSDAFSRFAVSGSMRTGMPKVNRKHLAEFCFDLPSTEDQDQYLSRVRAIRAAMDQIAERRMSLVSVKSTAIGEMEVA